MLSYYPQLRNLHIACAVASIVLFVLRHVLMLRGIDWRKSLAQVLGWTLLAWAALRLSNGAGWFFGVIAAFLALQVLLPALRGLWSLPPKPKSAVENGTAPAVALAAGDGADNPSPKLRMTRNRTNAPTIIAP